MRTNKGGKGVLEGSRLQVIYIVGLSVAAVVVFGRFLLMLCMYTKGEVMSKVGVVALVRCSEGGGKRCFDKRQQKR